LFPYREGIIDLDAKVPAVLSILLWPSRSCMLAGYVFVTERGSPMSPDGWNDLFARIGVAARMEFCVHPHMLRHACGFKLANDGRDTRTIQEYLDHKSIASTALYTRLAAGRFNGLWSD